MDLPESLRFRLICHFLVSMLPEEGLIDAFEELREMVKFYHATAELKPVDRLFPPGKPIKATVRNSYVRPVYPITDEE